MSWGDDAFGPLGNGTASANDDAQLPVAVTGVTAAVQVSTSGEHALALLANGTAMAWGDNNNGQLGNGTTTNSDVPVAVKGLTKVKAVSAGYLFSVAVLTNGTVMAWGDNGDGELGNGTYNNSDVPVAVTGVTLVANGTVMGWGDNGFNELAQSNGFPGGISNSDVPIDIPGVGPSSAVAAGGLFGLALLTNGTVLGWGDNALGQLGNGTTNQQITPAAVSGLTGVRAISAGSTAWSIVPSPNPGGTTSGSDSELTAIAGTGPDDLWAAGSFDIGAEFNAVLLEHWNGTAWSAVAPPDEGGRGVRHRGHRHQLDRRLGRRRRRFQRGHPGRPVERHVMDGDVDTDPADHGLDQLPHRGQRGRRR
jgi:Regulator of chromosome condensation (RCC1) repeat